MAKSKLPVLSERCIYITLILFNFLSLKLLLKYFIEINFFFNALLKGHTPKI
jgi:hypothetical protein